MTHSDFIKWLGEIETQLAVADWRVGELHVWPMLRLSLYASTFHARTPEHSLEAGRVRQLKILVAAMGAWARASWKDRRGNRRPTEPADAVFLSYSIGRQPFLDGRRYNVLTAPYADLVERAGRRALVWEMSPFGEYNIPRYLPSHFVQPRVLATRALYQVKPLGHEPVQLDGYGSFLDRVSAAGLHFPHANVARIRRDAAFIRALADRFVGWLLQARPTVGFVADTSPREQAFCLACRELGIASVEIQHGVQGALHPSYAAWLAVPPGGYETRAQVFWCWDRESASAINRWAATTAGAHRAVVGGDPWRAMWSDETNERAIRVHENIAEWKRQHPGDRHLLVTLTSSGPLLPDAVEDAIRRSPPGWRYWLRLHPVNQEPRRREAQALLPGLGVSVDLMNQATEVPLHALLRHMDAHITLGMSMVVREAAAAGVRSIAPAGEAREFYATETATGMLVTATTADEILAAIEAMPRERARPAAEDAGAPARVMQQLLPAAHPETGPATERPDAGRAPMSASR